jgi:hypothetical protein
MFHRLLMLCKCGRPQLLGPSVDYPVGLV